MIDYPEHPHEHRGWRYDPFIDQDGDGFDRAYHLASHPDLPADYLGKVAIEGHWSGLLSAKEFEAEIDRLIDEGLPPPPPKVSSANYTPPPPRFARIVEDLRNA